MYHSIHKKIAKYMVISCIAYLLAFDGNGILCKAVITAKDICDKWNAVGTFPNPLDTTCKQYALCFVNGGILSGTFYNCSGMTLYNSNMRLCTLDYDCETLPSIPTAIPTSSETIPTTSTAIPTSPDTIPTTSTAIATSSGTIPTTSTAIPTSSDTIPTTSTAIPTSPDTIPTTSTAIVTSSGMISTTSTAIPTFPDTIPTTSTAIPT